MVSVGYATKDKRVYLSTRGASISAFARNNDELEFVDTGEQFVYYNGKWIRCDHCHMHNLTPDVNRDSYPTNCVNCGAVLHENKCEYCGTEYHR